MEIEHYYDLKAPILIPNLDHVNLQDVSSPVCIFDDKDQIAYLIADAARSVPSLSFIDLRGNGVGIKARLALRAAIRDAPISPLSKPQTIAFWMCKQVRLGASSPAKKLWYGMLIYICSFLGEERQILL